MNREYVPQGGALSRTIDESTYLAVTDFECVQGAPAAFEGTSEVSAQ
jgi:hypothetical protein